MSASLLYFLGQLATGTGVYAALLFTAAICFGLYSVWAAGGLLSAFGALNAILIGKFLLIGIALKILIGEPADSNLLAPESTAGVMALGFLGLLLGTRLQRHLPARRTALIPEIHSAEMYLALALVFFFCGYGGYLIGLHADLAGDGIQTGGILGIARILSSVKSFAIVPAMYFASASGSRRFMTHPLVLAVLLIGILGGIFSTSKLGAMESMVFYVLVAGLEYGMRDRRVLLLAAAGVVYYAGIVYPYSQYVRSHGGREGGLSERLQAMQDVFERVASNHDDRDAMLAAAEDPNGSYLGHPSLRPFGRLAMVGQADRLIAASAQPESRTGWYTVIWGLKLALPSFLYPDKPIFGTGNYLAHITGEVGPHDQTTQGSYGVIANFFNAFSYTGAWLGTAVFFCCFYEVLQLFVGNPRWSAGAFGSSVWFLFIVTIFQHLVVEESVAGQIASLLNLTLAAFVLYLAARAVCPFLPAFPEPGTRAGDRGAGSLTRISQPVSASNPRF